MPTPQEAKNTIDALPAASTVCTFCRHLISNTQRKCAAFDLIPETIWLGENKHTAPVPGDKGIRFESI